MTVSNEQASAVYQLAEPPHSFGRALWQLPGQYWRILIKPSPEAIAAESGNPSWGIVWLQLLGMATFSGSVAILSRSFIPPALTPVQLSELSSLVDPQVVQQVLNASSTIHIGLTFLVTFLAQFIGFFLLMGSLHLVSVKFMGRQGSFRSLCYSMLLATLPLMLVTGSVGTNPYLAVLSVAGSLLYMLVLQTMVTMATYRLSARRAFGAFLLSILLLAAVFLAVVVFFSAVIVLGVIQIL